MQRLDITFRVIKLVLVSLARAVYSRASLLILDDVLSAGQYETPLLVDCF